MGDDSYEAWLQNNPPPDLQELVAGAGGYHLITEAMWREYDAGMADWQARRKNRTARSAS
jgi:hypothetical protein